MKGLIRNNFYSMEDSLKLTSAINIMMAIGVSVLGIFNSFARSWIAIVITDGKLRCSSGFYFTKRC